MIVKTAVRKVTRLGNPVLREGTRPVSPAEISDPSVQRLIDEMIVTLDEYCGVGVAAPQVDQPLALFVMGLAAGTERHPDGIELSVVFNPTVRFIGAELETDWEGCLSVPGLRGQVPRRRKLELSGLDREGAPFTRVYEGFPARVVQHETDHLMGKVYLDRMPGLATLAFTDELARR